MSKTKFVTKDNVHEATDVPRIRSLMANAERLGESVLVLKCSERLTELKREAKPAQTEKKVSKRKLNTEIQMRDEIFDINFTHWLGKNTYYGSGPLNSSMRTAQTKMKNDFQIEYNFERCDDLIEEIENVISSYRTTLDEKLAIKAFDLIQLWGGGMGVKGFYYSGTRQHLNSWLPHYQDFINKIEVDTRNSEVLQLALTSLLKIKGIGMSFGTKHLRFWARLPIFDDRISLLLYSKKCKKVSDYAKFIQDIYLLSKASSLDILDVEKSLFAFSQNYFMNDKLTLLNDKPEGIDSEVAMKIAF